MAQSDNKQPAGILRSLDWWTIGIYLALLCFGWISVCGASYTYGDNDIFSLGARSGMQIIWIGTSIALGFVILMMDDRFFDTFAYVIYAVLILLLFATIFNPHSIKGSHSWLVLGPLRLQPAEFGKFATALAVAKFMCSYGFNIHKMKHFMAAVGIILLPMICIVGQRENVTHEMSVMKNEFYNDAANRLRTPLTLIGTPVKTILDTEPGITRKGKELLRMVVDNANEMLVMLDKVQRYGNKADFRTNSGLSEEDYDLAEGEKENGQIDDRNASDYLEEVNKQKKDEEAKRLEEMGKEQKEAQGETELKDQTVLVVEDNTDLRKFLYSILSPTYNVLLAENGKAGLVMVRKEIPDFILTDVTMPVMDGLLMIHEIKQDTTLNNIPVMILSAKASVENQQRGFDEGVDAYITKPFSTPYLLGRIEAILTQRRNIQMDVIRKLKETGDKDAIAALRILPAAAPLPALNQAETSAENEAVDPNSELAFMAAQIQDRTMMRVFTFSTLLPFLSTA